MAVLVLGLRDDSRIKLKYSGNKLTLEQMLQALMVDDLNYLAWTKTKAAQRGRDKPNSIFKKLTGLDDKCKEELMTFETPEDFNAFMEKKRLNNG